MLHFMNSDDLRLFIPVFTASRRRFHLFFSHACSACLSPDCGISHGERLAGSDWQWVMVDVGTTPWTHLPLSVITSIHGVCCSVRAPLQIHLLVHRPRRILYEVEIFGENKKSSTTPESELRVERTWMNLSVTCWFFGYGSHQPRGFFFNETLQRLRSSRRWSQRPELLRLICTEMKGTSCCWIRTREEEEEDASASRQVFLLTISVQVLTICLWRYIFIWFFCIFVSTCLD